MCDPVQTFSFWLKHPSVRNRPPSATIFDILDTLISMSVFKSEDGYYQLPPDSLEDRENLGEEYLEEEARDTIGPLRTDAHSPSDRTVPPRRCASTSLMPRRVSREETPPPMAYSGTSLKKQLLVFYLLSSLNT